MAVSRPLEALDAPEAAAVDAFGAAHRVEVRDGRVDLSPRDTPVFVSHTGR